MRWPSARRTQMCTVHKGAVRKTWPWHTRIASKSIHDSYGGPPDSVLIVMIACSAFRFKYRYFPKKKTRAVAIAGTQCACAYKFSKRILTTFIHGAVFIYCFLFLFVIVFLSAQATGRGIRVVVFIRNHHEI